MARPDIFQPGLFCGRAIICPSILTVVRAVSAVAPWGESRPSDVFLQLRWQALQKALRVAAAPAKTLSVNEAREYPMSQHVMFLSARRQSGLDYGQGVSFNQTQ